MLCVNQDRMMARALNPTFSFLGAFANAFPGWIAGALRRLAPLALLLAVAWPATGQAQSRIKDIANFEGIRENLLVGYGLVVGLNGTGDDLDSAPFTRESLIGMLQRLGINARDDDLDTANVAAVMVTANLPPFARHGTRIDITVSALGGADSLLGGTLLVSPLLAADGEVYAVAQGSIAVAGFSAEGDGQSVTKGVPTSGRIPNGAIVEREIAFDMAELKTVKISLRNPDLTTARRLADKINAFLKTPAARSTDPGTVLLEVPERSCGLDSELVGEDPARCLVGLEGLRLAPGPVEGQDQLRPESLAKSVGVSELLELADQLAVAAQSKVGVEPFAEGDEVELFEPGAGFGRERSVRELGEWRAAPKLERAATRGRRLARPARLQRLAAAREQRAVASNRALREGKGPASPPVSGINTEAWQVPEVPSDLRHPGIEITGPVSITNMFINALNPGPEGMRAEGDLDDDEDSASDRARSSVPSSGAAGKKDRPGGGYEPEPQPQS